MQEFGPVSGKKVQANGLGFRVYGIKTRVSQLLLLLRAVRPYGTLMAFRIVARIICNIKPGMELMKPLYSPTKTARIIPVYKPLLSLPRLIGMEVGIAECSEDPNPESGLEMYEGSLKTFYGQVKLRTITTTMEILK